MSKIKHVIQEDSNGCVIACVAMITGQTYEEIKKHFELPTGKGIGSDERDIVFVRHGFWPIRCFDTSMYPDKLYIVSVPSLNHPAIMHAIVVDCRGESFEVYDPQKGNEGKKYYCEESLKGYAGVTEIIDCNTLHEFKED